MALLTLVDSVNGQKTVERSSGALRSCIDPATPDKAQPVLDLLANEEVIRRRMDPGTRESSWLLDHDYLARAVREADRRANKWQRALAEGAKALADAVGWAPRWRALLTPRTQVAFFFDRLCGRFRYAGYRAYAIISLQRLGPYVAIFFTIVAVGIYEAERRSEQEIQTASDDILNGLVFRDSNGISEDEAGTLLRLASAEEAVRRRVLTLVLTDQHRASAFVLNPELVIRAIVGVSPRSRVLAATSLRGATAQTSENPPLITRAIAEAARVAGVSETLPLEWWMASIRGNADPDVLGSLVKALPAFSTKLSNDQAEEVRKLLLTAADLSTDENVTAALQALPTKASDTQVQVMGVIEQKLAAIEKEKSRFTYVARPVVLSALTSTLVGPQTEKALDLYLATFRKTTSAAGLSTLSVRILIV